MTEQAALKKFASVFPVVLRTDLATDCSRILARVSQVPVNTPTLFSADRLNMAAQIAHAFPRRSPTCTLEPTHLSADLPGTRAHACPRRSRQQWSGVYAHASSAQVAPLIQTPQRGSANLSRIPLPPYAPRPEFRPLGLWSRLRIGDEPRPASWGQRNL